MERFAGTIRRLSTCFQALEACKSARVRSFGLTPPQFEVLATLGEMSPMTCRELGERTLITKGTLTGVLDRLASRGLVGRLPSPADRRGVLVSLTPEGDRLRKRALPLHLDDLREAFGELSDAELDQLDTLLEHVVKGLSSSGCDARATSSKARMIAAAARRAC